MNQSRRSPIQQWRLPLQYEDQTPLSESVRAEAVRALADLLLEAAGQMLLAEANKEASDEPKNQA